MFSNCSALSRHYVTDAIKKPKCSQPRPKRFAMQQDMKSGDCAVCANDKAEAKHFFYKARSEVGYQTVRSVRKVDCA